MIASSNLFSSTQAVAPVGNNTTTGKHLITVAQFQEKNLKSLKAKSSQTRKTKINRKQNKTKQNKKLNVKE